MNTNRQWFNDFLRANFTSRRIPALLVGLGCIAVGLLVVFGMLQLSLWATLAFWVAGLFILEWAG